MGRLPIGAARVFHRPISRVMSGAFGTSRVTTWFADFTEVRAMSPVARSYVSVVSVYRRPKDEAEVTMRGLPAGSGTVQTYALWVWPVTSVSTCGVTFLAMSTIGPDMPSPAPGESQS